MRKERKENGLFNDALNTFYLRLYGIGHIVEDYSDSEMGKPYCRVRFSTNYMVRALAEGRRIDPHGGPIELFLVPAFAPRLAVVCVILSVG